MTDEEIIVNTNKQAFGLYLSTQLTNQLRSVRRLPTQALTRWLKDAYDAKIAVNVGAELVDFVFRYAGNELLQKGADAIAEWLDSDWSGNLVEEYRKWIEEGKSFRDDWTAYIIKQYGGERDA